MGDSYFMGGLAFKETRTKLGSPTIFERRGRPWHGRKRLCQRSAVTGPLASGGSCLLRLGWAEPQSWPRSVAHEGG